MTTDPTTLAFNFSQSVILYATKATLRGTEDDPNIPKDESTPRIRFSWIPCCICVGGGGGNRKNSTAILLLTIGVAFSFFIMMRYTFKSLASYVDCAVKLGTAKLRLKAGESAISFSSFVRPQTQSAFPPPPQAVFSPQTYQPAQPSAPPASLFSTQPTFQQVQPQPPQFPPFQQSTAPQVTNPFDLQSFSGYSPSTINYMPNYQQPFPTTVQQQPVVTVQNNLVKGIYESSQIILRKLKTDNKYSFIFQGTIALGCGLLTTALIVAFLFEAEFLLMTLAVTGGGAVIVGAVGFGLKYAFVKWDEDERNALQNLKLYSSQLQVQSTNPFA